MPLATLAVLTAALAMVGPLRLRYAERRPAAHFPAVNVGSVREAFVGGEPGREDVVLKLDLLERKISRPDLPARKPWEIAEIVRQPPAAFREYVRGRVDELEARS